MMRVCRRWSPGWTALVLVGLTLACRPSAATNSPTPGAADPFAVVRATAEAAYESGQGHLERGELEAALVDFDTAKTFDADNRQDIQQALDLAISRLAAETPTVEPTSRPRTPVIATVQTLAAPAAATLRPGTQATSEAGSSPNLVVWRDPEGRFSVSAPATWATVAQPQSLFGIGTGIVQFRDSSGRAELDVAVDSSARPISPELYAASLEIALQQQVPGYAAEQMRPANTSGNPSMRRVFTFTQRDSAGRDYQARGIQVTLVKGSTPYLISGSAPAEQFQQDSATFDRMVESFRFS
jgi:hypothetical protein